jgi:hypothetical protein
LRSPRLALGVSGQRLVFVEPEPPDNNGRRGAVVVVVDRPAVEVVDRGGLVVLVVACGGAVVVVGLPEPGPGLEGEVVVVEPEGGEPEAPPHGVQLPPWTVVELELSLVPGDPYPATTSLSKTTLLL